jgi:RNA polymerase sigma factor (sigma-70 family)
VGNNVVVDRNQVTDGAAIARSVAEPDAFLVVFDRHYDTIARYLARRLPETLAEDLAAETFTRAFAARSRYDATRADALPFLFGIAANLVRRHRRSEQRMLRAYSRAGAGTAASVDEEPTDTRNLAAVLAALSAQEREVLLLVAWADLDYAHIAEALEIPIGTVRSRLNRARVRLQERARPAESVQKEVLDG